jgi:DNA invertase Pin-like site-specific DNA recombinase
MNAARRTNRATAYSYLRFSTPEQMRGDSFRRQTELSQQYAEEHGLDLDNTLTFRDLGVSAFRGRNIAKGALGDFLRAVESGRVQPGSWLLVESLDRLSRDNVMAAFGRFSEILSKGITVATLQDGKVYTAKSVADNFGELIVSLGVMFRANEESVTKAKRLRAAWGNKRKRAREGHTLTSRVPYWLTLVRGQNGEPDAFTVNEDRAAVVRRLFDMSIAGHGMVDIARRLNTERVPMFGGGRSWSAASVQRLLETEAVYGVFQPQRIEVDAQGREQRVDDGEPVRDYFPAIVSEETYLLAKKARSGRRIAVSRNGAAFSNLFTGLAVCGCCGAPMHYVNKGSGEKGGTFLVCSNARRGVDGCRYFSWKYTNAERLVIECLEEIDLRELFPSLYANTESALQALSKAKATAEARLEKAKEDVGKVVQLLVDRPNSPGLLTRLDATEKSVVDLTAEVERLAQDTAAEHRKRSDAERGHRDTRAALKQLHKAHAGDAAVLFDLRSRLHQLLRRTLERVVFTPEVDKLSPLHGEVAVTFAGADFTRVVRVYRGQTDADTFQVVDGRRSGPTKYRGKRRA